jgi:hypothetical protein
MGGRAQNGIPVIALRDPIVGNWSDTSSLPGVEYFSTENIRAAAARLNEIFAQIIRERAGRG